MSSAQNLFSRVYRKNQPKQTRVLGIMASPREGANTDILLEAVLDRARSNGAITDKIKVNELSLSACQACDDVLDTGRCKIPDDFQKIYDAVLTADSIVVASPVYFGSISAQLKILIDRFQCHWRARNLLKTINPSVMKKGGFICVQASFRQDFFDNAKAVVKNFFATADIEYSQEVFCPGLLSRESIREKPDCLKKAMAMGQQLSGAIKGQTV